MSSHWNWPGSRWWKFDFHTHTPASMDATPWGNVVDSDDEVTPKKWLLRYMEAGIDCVAVTDHNTGEWIDCLKEAYDKMKLNRPQGFRELHIFPGVEISVYGGIHLLAIFDIQEGSEKITSLLGAVRFPDDLRGHTDSQHDAACTRKSLVEVVEEVHRRDGIAIPAHCDRENGLLQTEDGNKARHPDAIKSLLNAPILAIEVVDQRQPKPSLYLDSSVHWTEVLGSDCHSFRAPTVPGSRYTWVKMTTPSLEGLRLALLDGPGVSIRRSDEGPFDPLQLPEHFVEEIEIESMRYMGNGRPAKLRFSPYFNALIGGRGTGKSTVIHAFRLAYRRKEDLERLDEQSEVRRTFERFSRVPRDRMDEGGLREDTHVTVSMKRGGIGHRIHWRQEGMGTVVEEKDDGGWKESISQEVSPERFPVRIFSQGQIVALAGESQEALLALIDDAAESVQYHKALEEAKRSYFASRARIREVDSRLRERDTITVNLEDVERKLRHFEATGHADILKKYRSAERQEREVSRQFDQLEHLARRVRDLADELCLEDIPPGTFVEGEDADILDILAELKKAVEEARETLIATAERLGEKVKRLREDKRFADWELRVKTAREAYGQLVQELQREGIEDPAEYGRLVQERQRLEAEKKRLDDLQKKREELERKAKEELERAWEVRRQVSRARQKFLSNTLAENPFVRIELIPWGAEARTVERGLREMLGATDDRFSDDILVMEGDTPAKGLVADFVNADDKEIALRKLQKRLLEGSKSKGRLGGHFRNYLRRQAEQRPEFVDHILTWFPEDGLKVEYSRSGDGRDFQPIAQASAGQRAAAMLAFLLSYGDEPLILDQPEDDLDNHLIYDLVVRQIREHKMRRQLIVVTHNPNIVVNGDAEYIHALEFRGGQCFVSQSGTLQEKEMREEICRIMEGGREAFERRWRRLGKEV